MYRFKNEQAARHLLDGIDNVYDRIISLRAIKDEDEIELIKKAINITRLSLEAVMKKLPSASFSKNPYPIAQRYLIELTMKRKK